MAILSAIGGEQMHGDYDRCQHISPQGVECNEWFQIQDNEKYCPFHLEQHTPTDQQTSIIPELTPETHKDRWNRIAATCYEMSMDELEAHLKEREENLQRVLQYHNTELSAIRAVKGDRIQKMSAQERRARQRAPKHTNKPANQPTNQPTNQQATANKQAKSNGDKRPIAKLANQYGISMDQLLKITPESIEAYKRFLEKNK
jgi:activator of HSP90 ATPase